MENTATLTPGVITMTTPRRKHLEEEELSLVCQEAKPRWSLTPGVAEEDRMESHTM